MAHQGARILIVDDDRRNRRLLEALLAPEGYTTTSVATGVDALASIAEQAPDLVLLDVMMPEMDGHQVARLIKADPATQSIPIIMVTDQSDRVERLAALDAGAEEFLTKPVDRAELWLRVRNLLRLKELTDLLEGHRSVLEDTVRTRTSDLQRFRTAMDATGEAIFLVNRATMRFVEVNATATTMLGYSREELLQLGPADISDTPLDELHATYDALIAEKRVGTATYVARCRDGSHLAVEVHRHAQHSNEGWLIVVVLRDITERKEAESRLHHLAHYDTLTGLPNRALFYETLERAVKSSQGSTIAVLFIDLDHFKKVNDTLGHASGDELLAQVSNRLTECVRTRDTVGRLGGDEFALILTMRDGQHDAATVAQKIRAALKPPFDLKGQDVTVTASIGIAAYPDDAADPETLIRYADTAMYEAKQAGRDTFRFFTARMNIEVLERLEMERALRHAVKGGEFLLHYQPKVQLVGGHVVGLEALLRWQRSGHGLMAPKDFIPVLEESGIIVDVGRWVIGAACEQIALWMVSPVGAMPVSVNVSARQFVEGDLEGDVVRALESTGIPPGLLELELTESTLMANTDRTIAILSNLRQRGVHVSIDDFGTGYSSLAYLRRFPIDKLKIDITFIRDITSDADDAAIALAIIRMAHSLKMDVIAEGVETESQLAYLRRHHCDEMQGYYFSPPLVGSALEELLVEGRRLTPPSNEPGPSPNTLLLVDDDPVLLEVLQVLLGIDGYRILTAGSAQEGFELLALHEVHVVMCDQRMPDMSGIDFLNQIKELHPHALRIVLSSYTDEEAMIDSINRGAVHRFYTKPWDGEELRGNIRAAFRHYWHLREGGGALDKRAGVR